MTTKRAAAKEKKKARSKQTGAATTMNKHEHCGEPCDVWQLHASTAGLTDDKELRMAWQQCNEELKNLPTNNSNNKENKDSRNMTTKGAAAKREEESKEQTNRCSNNNEQT